MNSNIHLHKTAEPFEAFKADTAYLEGFNTLDVHDDRGNTVIVFVNTYEQAQQLVEAAVELRRAFREQRDADVVAELSA